MTDKVAYVNEENEKKKIGAGFEAKSRSVFPTNKKHENIMNAEKMQ